MSIISQRFGKTNSAVLWRKGHHFCISLYVVSAGGGNVMDGAGTPNSLKNPSKPAGVSCTSIRTCSESIVNECTTSRGAKTIVPGVALISGVLLAYEGDVARMPFLGVRDGEWELVVDGALVALYEFTLQHLEQKGCRSVDLGESQTFLNDGVLRSKRKYGHILSSASIHKFLIRVLSDTSATRAFLQNNPFIFQHAGELRGAVFLDAAVPPSRQILDEIHK